MTTKPKPDTLTVRMDRAEKTQRQMGVEVHEAKDDIRDLEGDVKGIKTMLQNVGVPRYGLIYTFCAFAAVISTAMIVLGGLFGMVPLTTWTVLLPAAALLGFAVCYRAVTALGTFLVNAILWLMIAAVIVAGVALVVIPVTVLLILSWVIRPLRRFALDVADRATALLKEAGRRATELSASVSRAKATVNA